MPSRISQMRNGANLQQMPQQSSSIQQQTPQFQLNEEYLNYLKTIMRSKNPMQMLNNLMAQNPQIRQIVEMVSKSNNQQLLFEMLAQQRGVDPNAILNQLMS